MDEGTRETFIFKGKKGPGKNMQGTKRPLAVFYCHHQRKRIAPILEEWHGSADVDLQVIALPCSGKIEVFHVTKALEKGADGVAVFGCRQEKCQYVIGSQRAMGRIRYAQKIMEEVGIDEDRLCRFILKDAVPLDGKDAFALWVKTIQSKGSLFHRTLYS